MTLDEYLEKYGILKTEFAERLGKTPANFTCLVRRNTSPGLPTALTIHELTNGEVTFRDMLSYYDEKRMSTKKVKSKDCGETRKKVE